MDLSQLVVDGLFRQFGRPATWQPRTGDPTPVRLLPKRPDVSTTFADTTVLTATARFELRVAEVAAVERGDRFTCDGVPYTVQSASRLDPDRLVWTLETYGPET